MLLRRTTPLHRHWSSASSATALLVSLNIALVAVPVAAQNGASGSPDTTTLTPVAACNRMKVYGNQVAADSVKTLWDKKMLFPTLDSIKARSGGALQISLDTATVPDSLRAAMTKAGRFCRWTPPPSNIMAIVQAETSKPRPILGFQLGLLTPKDTANLGMSDMRGLVVQSVMPNYGGQAAGIVAGDVLLSVNGQSVATIEQFLQQAVFWKDGETIALAIVRKGSGRQSVNVVTKMKQ